MKILTSTVTYRVPSWGLCNLELSKECCRFCVKDHGKHVCVLHNEILKVEEGVLVHKAAACGKKQGKEIADVVAVPPRTIVKSALKRYRKIYKQLISQGVPEDAADEHAQKLVLE